MTRGALAFGTFWTSASFGNPNRERTRFSDTDNTRSLEFLAPSVRGEAVKGFSLSLSFDWGVTDPTAVR